jgi:DNA-directed RNA polymerase subunit RPC12/RpoP
MIKYPKPAPENTSIWIKILARFIEIPYRTAGSEEGFRERVTIYLIRCSKCKKYFLDYKHGHLGYFICPYCGSKLD